MAANLAYHQPFKQVKTVSGNSPLETGQIQEAASQTWAQGVPLMLDGSGRLIVWDGSSLSNSIIGVSTDYGHNLSAGGKGAPVQPFGSVGAPGTFVTYGNVPNQPSAFNIPPGAPLSDGRQVFNFATGDTWFEGQIDNNTGSAAVTAISLIGGRYGISFDTSTPAQAYVDLAKTGGSAAVIIMELNPLDPLATAEGRVWLKFISAVTTLG